MRGPRSINQDTFLIDLDLGLIVVADGMGGHRAGEVASRMAVDAIVEFIRATGDEQDLTWPFPMDLDQSFAVNRLGGALRVANRVVFQAGSASPAYAGMGTTVVAALVHGDRIIVGHVGDSRAYLWRDGQLIQITSDHTWVNAVGGQETPDHPMRHVLTSSIGMGPDLVPAVTEHPLQAGERWLMCTDGVHGYLPIGDITKALVGGTPQAAADAVVNRALESGTADNATAVVLNVE